MGKKIDKAFDAMRESNRLYLEDMKNKDAPDDQPGDGSVSETGTANADADSEIKEAVSKADQFHKKEKLELEKGDLPALVISAMLVFGPVFLILGIGVVLAWFLLH